jgi:mycoredoxin
MGQATRQLLLRSVFGSALLILAGTLCLLFFPTSALSTRMVEWIKQPPPHHFAEDPGEGFVVFYPIQRKDGTVHYASNLSDVPPEQRDTAGKLVLAQNRPTSELGTLPPVTLYSAEWCGYCKRTTKLLDELGVAFVHKDIERSEAIADELLALSGDRKIPFLLIDGKAVRGYDRDRILDLLGK